MNGREKERGSWRVKVRQVRWKGEEGTGVVEGGKEWVRGKGEKDIKREMREKKTTEIRK